MLAGRTHNLGIHEWGRNAEEAIVKAFGFKNGRTPAASTLHLVLKSLDWEEFAEQLRDWALALLRQLDPLGEAALSCDGKAVRGSLRAGAEVAHLVSIFTSELGITLDLDPVDTKSSELDAAPRLLLRLPIAGRTLVADALFTQPSISAAVVKAGADYVLPVKGNQPGLQAELRAVFAAPLPYDWRCEEAETFNRAHGRQEHRRLVLVAPPPEERVDWPGVQQYYLLQRWRYAKDWRGRVRQSFTAVYGVTSLGRDRAGARKVLDLVRGHWGIENRSHWIRDTLLREDDSRLATTQVVKVLAGLRGTVLTILHGYRRTTGARSVAAARRKLEQDPWVALDLLRGGL